jgi:hypothetical protein
MLAVSARLSTKNFVRLGTWTAPAGTADTVPEAMNAPITKYSTASACKNRINDLGSGLINPPYESGGDDADTGQEVTRQPVVAAIRLKSFNLPKAFRCAVVLCRGAC